MDKIVRFGARLLLLATLLVVPLQSYWVRIAERADWADKPFFWLIVWYEPLVLLILLLSVACFRQLKIVLTKLDWLFVAVLLYTLASYFWADHSASYHIIGLRHSLPLIYFYFLTRIAQPTDRAIDRVLGVTFWVVVLVGLVQAALIVAGQTNLLEALQLPVRQYVGTFPRVESTLPGPNQFSTYLVLMLLILQFRPIRGRDWLTIGGIPLLLLSFSRSALLGFLAAGLAYLGLDRTGRAKQVAWLTACLLLLGVGVTLLRGLSIQDLVFHGQSTPEHASAFSVALDKIQAGSPLQLLIGHGAGESGPATFVRTQSFIPENWFLQVVYEYGLIGLGLFVALFVAAATVSIRLKEYLVALAVLAILVNSFFLHPLSDNMPGAFLLALMIGLLGNRLAAKGVDA